MKKKVCISLVILTYSLSGIYNYDLPETLQQIPKTATKFLHKTVCYQNACFSN